MAAKGFGWDLPPGCSTRDLEEAMGANIPDPSPESERVEMLFEHVEVTPEGFVNYASYDGLMLQVLLVVDALAQERDRMAELLSGCLRQLPPDVPRPPCTCHPTHPHDFSWCALHDTGADEQTLREEIQVVISRFQKREEQSC